jgi:tRNA-dihydrouridine synthase 2
MIGCTRHVCDRTSTVYWSRISSNGVRNPELHPEKKESVIYRLHPTLEHKKLIFQIGTATPELAVEAARMVAADVAGIDVNSGCPKPFSTTGGMGAALLRDPDRLCSILEALVKEVGEIFEIGISVKIRILADKADTENLVRRLVNTGITGLTVHCRTTPMRPRERAIRDQLRMIADICREAGVACLMNGDVETRDQALELMKEYGVDGAMIATAAEKNSSVFRSQSEGGKAHWKEVVRAYVESAMSVDNRWGNTKFLLAQLIPGKEEKNIGLQACRTHVHMIKALGYPELEELAAKIDEVLGMQHMEHVKRLGKRAAATERRNANAKKAKTQDDWLELEDKPVAEEKKPVVEDERHSSKQVILVVEEQKAQADEKNIHVPLDSDVQEKSIAPAAITA